MKSIFRTHDYVAVFFLIAIVAFYADLPISRTYVFSPGVKIFLLVIYFNN